VSVYNEAQLSSFVDQVFARLRKIEEQLAVLSEQAGVSYEAPSKSVPEEVVRLVEAGDRLGALRKYRELTGCGSEEAKEVVAGL
jgi:ribosomal protein L7/L12